MQLRESDLDDFMARHRLAPAFRETAVDFYLPLAKRLPSFVPKRGPLLLGINGAQGTGKSTLADFLDLAAGALFGWRTAILSIDDFYLTRAERRQLADDVHPLLATRGVPGTHDTQMMMNTLDALTVLTAGERSRLPRFDKSIDDRAPRSTWPEIEGPLDMIVLEGWCVGSHAEPPEALAEAVNDLERDEDPKAVWRRFVNRQLVRYGDLFARLHALVFLAAPSFGAVFRWRLEQERKLKQLKGEAATGVMGKAGVIHFVRHYERLTRHNLATIPQIADVVFQLDENHAVVASLYRERA